ncbi:hypothetical protein SynBIOSU31_00330 [Synechococcus sp. BIOS-U3-1]|nr:hypothetical protein SynBIOSU31_00330 [Synechococcus sp. BIOS-U3-1]
MPGLIHRKQAKMNFLRNLAFRTQSIAKPLQGKTEQEHTNCKIDG